MEVIIFKSLLYISSYIPLVVLIYLNNMSVLSFKEIINVYFISPFFWTILIIFGVLSFITLLIWLRSMKKEANSPGKKYKLMQLKSHDGEVMNYFVSYIIPLLSLDIRSNPSIVMNLILIVIIGIYFVKNNNLHYNILLLIMSYRVYSDDLDNIIITKMKLSEIKNKNLEADQIGTSNIFFM